ncbi:MAG: DUF5615 family PIN-like protein [Bryobacteraceae bacterium]|nr:DUF5615 family PIN-like protein [Bryobacteraceae bacterium]
MRQLGHDAVHLRDQGLMRMVDADIVEKALAEGRVVLTFDLDFGLVHVIGECQEQLGDGAFVTVEDYGYRVRRLPLK